MAAIAVPKESLELYARRGGAWCRLVRGGSAVRRNGYANANAMGSCGALARLWRAKAKAKRKWLSRWAGGESEVVRLSRAAAVVCLACRCSMVLPQLSPSFFCRL